MDDFISADVDGPVLVILTGDLDQVAGLCAVVVLKSDINNK